MYIYMYVSIYLDRTQKRHSTNEHRNFAYYKIHTCFLFFVFFFGINASNEVIIYLRGVGAISHAYTKFYFEQRVSACAHTE